MSIVALDVNGVTFTREIEDRTSLADFLREECGLTATHLGCEHGACGACSVLVDDVLTRSCLKFARQCEGRQVTTLEGVNGDAVMEALRRGFHEEHGLQCGFCTSGMLITARDLLLRKPSPSEAEIRDALAGNICRCTGYAGIVHAIQSAAARLMQPSERVQATTLHQGAIGDE
jgi:carbon-monoxide dehydrogenase small subunit